ncbi:hypothetical protein V6N12_075439 [Hibiscus sabdariffa]|uniref:Formin-like protein n=1 Tax=Hibiscus sabdariffa TaxID=183260 RepID=A0ABR2C9G5_9ROSI
MSGIISRKNEQFPKEFRAEIIFSEMDAASSVTPTDPFCYEEKEGLPAEAFAKVKEMFSNVDWLDSKSDAAYNMLQQIGASIIASEKSNSDSNSNVNSPQRGRMSPRTLWEEKLLAAFPGSPRSPTTMDLKTLVVPLDKSPSSKEAKPQDSKIEPFNQSDVSHQNNQSVALAKAQPSQASSSVSSPASAVASSVASPSTPSDKEGHFTRQTPPAKSPPPKTPPAKEDPAVRVTSPGTPPPKTPPVKENQTISGIPPEVSTSLKEVLAGLMTTPAAPILPFASPLSKIEAGRDGPLVVPPPPATIPHFKENAASEPVPPPPSLPPLHSIQEASPTTTSSAPPPPPPPSPTAGASSIPPPILAPPSPPTGSSSVPTPTLEPPSPPTGSSSVPPPTLQPPSHSTGSSSGSLWAEAQKTGEASKAPEIDISELENLFSAASPNTDRRKSSSRAAKGPKTEKVQLIDHRRAYNCEIMLSKVKVPLPELMNSVLALEESALDIDQVENLIKFCPTKEEMELLKGYTGDKDKLGKCEQFFLELMKVPRVESKLMVFSFKIQFRSQVSDLRRSLNIVNSTAEEIKNSVKLKRIMQTILTLGNALNQGTARGAAIGFRLDSLLKLTDTRARNNKMTLMHYLCKFRTGIKEEMQAISKGLEKVVQELSSSENDGHVSDNFREKLKEFLCFAEAEVRSLASLYSGVGRNVDALILYFGEDPAKCSFEQVTSTLLNFVKMFNKAHDENCKQLEQEMKKSAENEKSQVNSLQNESKNILQNSIKSNNVK